MHLQSVLVQVIAAMTAGKAPLMAASELARIVSGGAHACDSTEASEH
jgi:hypothetical protein